MIYSLMLVGRVERIFTRVGGMQLQSLAHPPGGGAWWAMMKCNVDMIILYIWRGTAGTHTSLV